MEAKKTTTKKPAAKKPVAPKPVVQMIESDEVAESKVKPVRVEAPVAPLMPAKKKSFRQAMKDSPQVVFTIPIDPAFDDEGQIYELGYLGMIFSFQRGVPVTMNELVKNEIVRKLKALKDAQERAKKARAHIKDQPK